MPNTQRRRMYNSFVPHRNNNPAIYEQPKPFYTLLEAWTEMQSRQQSMICTPYGRNGAFTIAPVVHIDSPTTNPTVREDHHHSSYFDNRSPPSPTNSVLRDIDEWQNETCSCDCCAGTCGLRKDVRDVQTQTPPMQKHKSTQAGKKHSKNHFARAASDDRQPDIPTDEGSSSQHLLMTENKESVVAVTRPQESLPTTATQCESQGADPLTDFSTVGVQEVHEVKQNASPESPKPLPEISTVSVQEVDELEKNASAESPAESKEGLVCPEQTSFSTLAQTSCEHRNQPDSMSPNTCSYSEQKDASAGENKDAVPIKTTSARQWETVRARKRKSKRHKHASTAAVVHEEEDIIADLQASPCQPLTASNNDLPETIEVGDSPREQKKHDKKFRHQHRKARSRRSAAAKQKVKGITAPNEQNVDEIIRELNNSEECPKCHGRPHCELSGPNIAKRLEVLFIALRTIGGILQLVHTELVRIAKDPNITDFLELHNTTTWIPQKDVNREEAAEWLTTSVKWVDTLLTKKGIVQGLIHRTANHVGPNRASTLQLITEFCRLVALITCNATVDYIHVMLNSVTLVHSMTERVDWARRLGLEAWMLMEHHHFAGTFFIWWHSAVATCETPGDDDGKTSDFHSFLRLAQWEQVAERSSDAWKTIMMQKLILARSRVLSMEPKT